MKLGQIYFSGEDPVFSITTTVSGQDRKFLHKHQHSKKGGPVTDLTQILSLRSAKSGINHIPSKRVKKPLASYRNPRHY
jgi:hypothetical protein